MRRSTDNPAALCLLESDGISTRNLPELGSLSQLSYASKLADTAGIEPENNRSQKVTALYYTTSTASITGLAGIEPALLNPWLSVFL